MITMMINIKNNLYICIEKNNKKNYEQRRVLGID